MRRDDRGQSSCLAPWPVIATKKRARFARSRFPIASFTTSIPGRHSPITAPPRIDVGSHLFLTAAPDLAVGSQLSPGHWLPRVDSMVVARRSPDGERIWELDTTHVLLELACETTRWR